VDRHIVVEIAVADHIVVEAARCSLRMSCMWVVGRIAVRKLVWIMEIDQLTQTC